MWRNRTRGQDLSEFFYELNVHMSTFFLPQINIAQMAKKLDIYTQRMKKNINIRFHRLHA